MFKIDGIEVSKAHNYVDSKGDEYLALPSGWNGEIPSSFAYVGSVPAPGEDEEADNCVYWDLYKNKMREVMGKLKALKRKEPDMKLSTERGNLYSQYKDGSIDEEAYMLVQVSEFDFTLVSSLTGNRWGKSESEWDKLMDGWYKVKGYRLLIIKEREEVPATFIHFNTRRPYTPEGQRIVAMYDGRWVTFVDVDRKISGAFEFPKTRLTEDLIMSGYDKSHYINQAPSDELKAEVKRLGWGEKL